MLEAMHILKPIQIPFHKDYTIKTYLIINNLIHILTYWLCMLEKNLLGPQ